MTEDWDELVDEVVITTNEQLNQANNTPERLEGIVIVIHGDEIIPVVDTTEEFIFNELGKEFMVTVMTMSYNCKLCPMNETPMVKCIGNCMN